MKNLQFTDSEFDLLMDLIEQILTDPPFLDAAGGFYLPSSKVIDLSDVDFDEIRDVCDKFRKLWFDDPVYIESKDV
jgi:hypothetical protein